MKRAGQELRAAWERVKTQVEQVRVIPSGDRAALTEDPRRAGQSLAKAEDALKKDAHRSLGAATHLLNHICVFGRS